MQFKKILIMIVSLTLINCMSHAVAQDDDKVDTLARVVFITAEEGHEQALEEAITAYHHYMGDKEGAFRYQWFSIVTGPDTGKYIARSGGHDWADFDAEHDWEKAAGEKFRKEVAPHIAEANVVIMQTDDELGMWPDNLEGYQYFSLTQWHVKSGHNAAFNEGLKKIDGILNEGGWPNYYAFAYPVSGGKGNQVTIVSPRKNFADMAPKEPKFMDIMGKAMGEDDTKAFMAEWGQTYYTGQNQLLKYRPKLSDYGD